MTARHAAPIDALIVDETFDGEVLKDEPLSKHTSYRLGGPARYFARVDSPSALARCVQACADEGVEWTVLGRGTNVLVADEGYNGMVVVLGRDFRNMRYDEETGRLSVGAALPLSSAVQEAFRYCLSGLEFAVGIPGTVGGALRGNAGSRTEWIGSHVVSVTTFTREAGLARRDGSEISWDYRSATFASDEVIVECELAVQPGDAFKVRSRMEESLSRRRATQPLDKPSCGSVFKSPAETTAAKLIDDLGLKGTELGGAQVSPVHANFIVNEGSATAHDVYNLIELVRQKVEGAYGIHLATEVRFLGFA